ncbi:DBIRD complex subunit ZNF326-like [Tursiops truncatus]|uniref:DBIRD complex subunit ZNF326-like n=1 Tax=Tursiops truncatus TaxID=9739 RepID=A0A6J3RNJ9_TURTR|nr:DBIRD complex subunit ZNF326-like [Tursiops truncatus]
MLSSIIILGVEGRRPRASAVDFEDDYTHFACRNTYQSFNGMDRDYGHGSWGGPRSMDSYLNQSNGMDSHSGGGGGSR